MSKVSAMIVESPLSIASNVQTNLLVFNVRVEYTEFWQVANVSAKMAISLMKMMYANHAAQSVVFNAMILKHAKLVMPSISGRRIQSINNVVALRTTPDMKILAFNVRQAVKLVTQLNAQNVTRPTTGKQMENNASANLHITKTNKYVLSVWQAVKNALVGNIVINVTLLIISKANQEYVYANQLTLYPNKLVNHVQLFHIAFNAPARILVKNALINLLLTPPPINVTAQLKNTSMVINALHVQLDVLLV